MILDNFPKVLWINLDRSEKRRAHMEKLLANLDHTRISAIDAKGPEFNNYCIADINSLENACTCSHLKALKYFVEETKENRIVIFEDDVSFEFLPFIPYNWSIFEKMLPDDYNVVQLALNTPNAIKTYLDVYQTHNYCAAAYPGRG